MKNISFTAKGWSDLIEWSKTDRKIFTKITQLIEETSKNPFKGTGKPEPLKYKLKGHWSRRINDEHRLVYTINDKEIKIISCMYHYE
jgi:toxin YoeB